MAAFLQNLYVWNCSYSLFSGFSGSAGFTNQNRDLSTADIWSVITISCTSTVDSDLVDDSCLDGSVNWINGIIHSVEDVVPIDESKVQVNIASFFSTLNNKPISTHLYQVTAGTALIDILQVYCGLPVPIFNITAGYAPIIDCVVDGANVWEECKKLADVCHSDLFVQVGGILIADPWKDHNSSIDIVLPPEVIISSIKSRSAEKGASRIRIRGRYISRYECGERDFSANPTVLPTSLSKQKCYVNGVGEPTSELVFKNLGASKAELSNAGYILSGDLQFDRMDVDSVGEGTAIVDTVPNYGTFLDGPPASPAVTNYRVLGRNKVTNDTQDISTIGKVQKAQFTKHDKILAALAHAPLGAMQVSNKDHSRSSDVGDKNRLESVILDTGLISEFGVVTDEVDNPYIGDNFSAFALAIRKIQEFLMARNTYKLVTAYLPCITLNDVVQFDTPDTLSTVIGRVINIVVNGGIDSTNVSMTLEIQSFEELAGRVYVSDNLIIYPELCGINQVHWVSTGGVYALSGYFAFETGAIVTQTLFTQALLSYTLTWDLILVSVSGSFRVDFYNAGVFGGSSSVYTASGTGTYVFVPSSSDMRLEFIAITGEWFFSNPFLTTTIVV